MTARHLLPIALAVALVPLPVHGQERAGPRGTIAGRVLDAGTRLPIAEAWITIRPAAGGLLIERGEAVAQRGVESAADGAYRFDDLATGRYVLRIERIGYRPATVEVDLRRPAEAGVSIALDLEPLALEPLAIQLEEYAPLFLRASHRTGELDAARILAERARQQMFVAPDARVLTYADMVDGVTLGEGDVFRALQRFPGVGTRDDYTAELWTRGAPWTHTRTTFDDIPLFNPLHAVGVLSAIAPDILGAVYFHPGVRPASVPSGAAGVVDLRSRAGGGEGRVRGAVDLSMAGVKVAADQRIEGRGGWVLAARRSHLDLWENGAGLLGTESIELPYVFHDVASRVDLVLGSRTRIEASGLWEEDRLFGDLDGLLERTEARWGNTAGRVTLRAGIGGLEVAHSIRASRFRATTDERFLRTRDHTEGWHEPASDNRIGFIQLAGEAVPTGDGSAPWSLGWDVAWQDVDYDGPLPRYHAVKPDTAARLRYRRELTVAGAWAEARHTTGRLTINPGVRIETGDDIADAPALRLAPRLALRWAFSPDHTVSLAAGRSWQYAQAIALGGPSIHPAFHASHFWVWPDGRTPALRSDIASIGTERWLGAWLASATAYVRHSAGVAVPDPVPGNLLRRAIHVTGENDARGVEIGLRRIGAAWSVSLGYSYALSEIEAEGMRYPAPSDRRHIMDAMAAIRLPAGFRLSAAYTAMAGAPFTRAVSRSPQDCELFGFGCGNQNAIVQEPNAVRTPTYHGLDGSLHWSRAFGGFVVGAYVQLRNALDRDNAVTYAGTIPLITRVRDGRTEIVWDDRLERGLPRMPLFGARVAF